MNRKLLFRFFEGNATVEEEERIRSWMETSDANKKALIDERFIYDSLTHSLPSEYKKRKRSFALLPWVAGASVAAVLLLVVNMLFLFNKKSEALQYNTLIVPPGQRINLILSDNTNLWLNANTTFKYPAEFSKDERVVFLDGEGYFEVSENVMKPFIVKTQQGDVQVTGTNFNVEAYSQYGSFSTSLFEGGVDIYKNEKKLVSLQPHEKSTLKENQLFVSKITDSDEYLWRDGLIAFKNKELNEILLTLEKYFSVDIQILTGNLAQHTYTGKFRQSDGVDYALRVLQRSIRFTYERDEDTGTVYIK